jgi:hypothetical protein
MRIFNVRPNVPETVQAVRETTVLLRRQIIQHKAAEDGIAVGYPFAGVGNIIGCCQDCVCSSVGVRHIFRVSCAVMKFGRNQFDPIRDVSMHIAVVAGVKWELYKAVVKQMLVMVNHSPTAAVLERGC